MYHCHVDPTRIKFTEMIATLHESQGSSSLVQLALCPDQDLHACAAANPDTALQPRLDFDNAR